MGLRVGMPVTAPWVLSRNAGPAPRAQTDPGGATDQGDVPRAAGARTFLT
ncbi:hypothetical protein [Actinomadura rudentiformis]|nr:hypothetical protein [Actinomadura rudentiformis]